MSKAQYFIIALMTKNVLIVSFSKIDVERLFNIARDVIIYRRDRLNLNTIETIMMIKYNLNNERALNEDEFSFLDNDEFFIDENLFDILHDLSLNLKDDENDENEEENEENDKNKNDDDENNDEINEHDDHDDVAISIDQENRKQQENSLENDDIVLFDSSLNDIIREFKRSCRRYVSRNDINAKKQFLLNQSFDKFVVFLNFLTNFSHRIIFAEDFQVTSLNNVIVSFTSRINTQSRVKTDSFTLLRERDLRSSNTQSHVKIEFFFTSHNLNK